MKSSWFYWTCAGMAYFNAFSSLNLPQTVSSVIAAVPIVLTVLWWMRFSPERSFSGRSSPGRSPDPSHPDAMPSPHIAQSPYRDLQSDLPVPDRSP
ncbi:MAG: hypothetical protein VKJ24_11995 [Synechococcales bacterium]|nr:hypothetical protein [Synechococcales bacterium]